LYCAAEEILKVNGHDCQPSGIDVDLKWLAGTHPSGGTVPDVFGGA